MGGGVRNKASNAQLKHLWGLAKKQGMDSDILHARCEAVTGEAHISRLTVTQCDKLLAAMGGGAAPVYKRRYQTENRPIDRVSQEQVRKIFGICRKLGWLTPEGWIDKVRLCGFLKSKYGVEVIDWMEPDTAVKATEALKAMLAGGRNDRKAWKEA